MEYFIRVPEQICQNIQYLINQAHITGAIAHGRFIWRRECSEQKNYSLYFRHATVLVKMYERNLCLYEKFQKELRREEKKV